jgi:hypothetical protein
MRRDAFCSLRRVIYPRHLVDDPLDDDDLNVDVAGQAGQELGDEIVDGAVAGARPMARRSGLARPLVALGHSLGEGQASEEVE